MSDNYETDLRLLLDSVPQIRRSAAAAIGRKHEARAIPALLSLIKDPDFLVRAAAVRALGDIGEITIIPTLLRLLKAGHPDVCREAAYALNRMGNACSLPHKILAEPGLTPEQRVNTLIELRNMDKGNFYVTLHYSIPDIQKFCRQASGNQDPDVVEGAHIVLAFLDNTQTLLRASQRDDSPSAKELLRAAGNSARHPSDTLLRASTENREK